MARRKTDLPAPAKEYLATEQGRHSRTALGPFYKWMRAHDLVLENLTPTHLDQFWEYEHSQNLAPRTIYVRRTLLRKYLYWLWKNDRLGFHVDPPPQHYIRAPLPAPAVRFLDKPGHRTCEWPVRQFHAWLRRKQVELEELTPAHLEAFLDCPASTRLQRSRRKSLHNRLMPYLLVLHDEGLVRFRPGSARVCGLSRTPNSVRRFIDTLRPIRKASTCGGYIGDLRGFHTWLEAHKATLPAFDREAAERWLKSLAERGLRATTRCNHISHVRVYLEWLYERGEFPSFPPLVLRPTDLPKIPTFLPRPFPRDADRELLQRFLASGTLYGQALFVMRRSGMRIGELVRLEPRCLQTDLHGNTFLKVPLGKLDNERLVPIDAQTRGVVQVLQDRTYPDVPFLLEPGRSRNSLKSRIQATLKETAVGLDIPGAVVSHRLRHTYATELLNAGMSLVGISKLLGHHSLRMTMRYAAITQATILHDYHAAMAKIAESYDLTPSRPDLDAADPARCLLDAIYWLRRHLDDNPADKRRTDALIKRLYKLRDDIAGLAPHA